MLGKALVVGETRISTRVRLVERDDGELASGLGLGKHLAKSRISRLRWNSRWAPDETGGWVRVRVTGKGRARLRVRCDFVVEMITSGFIRATGMLQAGYR